MNYVLCEKGMELSDEGGRLPFFSCASLRSAEGSDENGDLNNPGSVIDICDVKWPINANIL